MEVLSVTGIASLVSTLLTVVLILAVIGAVIFLLRARMVARKSGTLIVTELTATGDMQDAGFGAAATEALKVRLKALESEDVVRVDLATGASGGLALPAEVTAQLPQASLVSAILSLVDVLLPPHEWSLKGHLEPAVGGRFSISLTLMEGRHVARATSLRESDFSTREGAPPDVVSARQTSSVDYERYAHLITPAAVWLYYQTREFVSPTGSPMPRGAGSSAGEPVKKAPAPFGVANWQSYALTAAGAELQAANDAKGARTLYARALGLEPKNRMALFNLGVLDIRDGKRHARESRLLERGRLRFKSVRELSKEGGVANACSATGEAVRINHDGVWCRATYNLALANILMEDDGDLDEAAQVVSELIARLAAIQNPKDSIVGEADVKTYRTEMEPFATGLEPQVLILAAGLLYLHPDPLLKKVLAESIGAAMDGDVVNAVIAHVRKLGLNYRGHYNLAAYYARRGDRETAGSEEETSWYRLALDELDASFEAATSDLKAWALDDPSFKGLREYDDPEGSVRRLFGKADEPVPGSADRR